MKRVEGNSQFKMIIILLVIVLAISLLNSKFNLFNLWNTDNNQNSTENTASTNSVKITKVSGGEINVSVEIADTEEERQRGLMERTYLDQNSGMLFVFTEDVNTGFWMKNTLIPLDLIYVSNDLKIVDIKKNFKPCTTQTCEIYSSPVPFRYVLEVNGGYSDKNGVKVGDSVVVTSSST